MGLLKKIFGAAVDEFKKNIDESKDEIYETREDEKCSTKVPESKQELDSTLKSNSRSEALSEPKKQDIPETNSDMFSSRFETLINSALKDGVLTVKEREIIKKRAEAEGEDWGEVEMLLDARLEELQSDPSFLASQFLSIKERLDAKRHERVCAKFGSDNFKQLLGEESALNHELERCKLKLAKIGILDSTGLKIDYDALSKHINPTSQPQQSEVHATNVPSRVWNLNMHGQSSVIIPEGVEEIADNTFRLNESLTSITLPSTLKKIGKQVFLGTPLEEIDIPDSVEEIGIRAFEQCKKIKKITLPAKLKEIKEFTFLACDRLKEIDFSRCEELKIIREGAFSGTIIKEFILPDSVTSIERKAFNNGDNVKRVVMPASLEEIEGDVFYRGNNEVFVDMSKVTRLEVIPSNFCWSFNLTIPNGVTKIEEDAFYDNRGICSSKERILFLPPTVREIKGSEIHCNVDRLYVFAPSVEGLFETIDAKHVYVLPEYREDYLAYRKALGNDRGINKMPDEFLYYYDN